MTLSSIYSLNEVLLQKGVRAFATIHDPQRDRLHPIGLGLGFKWFGRIIVVIPTPFCGEFSNPTLFSYETYIKASK
jgi:hypothetical protein